MPIPTPRNSSLTLLGSVFFFLFCVAEVGAESTETIEGRKLFAQYCSSCHGILGKGDGFLAGSFKTPPADLTKIAARRDGKFPKAELAKIIDGRLLTEVHGKREMPVWGTQFSSTLGGGELGDEIARGKISLLIEYLNSIQDQ